jgi:hypothetical protein
VHGHGISQHSVLTMLRRAGNTMHGSLDAAESTAAVMVIIAYERLGLGSTLQGGVVQIATG